MTAADGRAVGYTKMKIILLTFRQLGLFGVDRLTEDTELFAFRMVRIRGKVDLTTADIYQKIKRDFDQEKYHGD